MQSFNSVKAVPAVAVWIIVLALALGLASLAVELGMISRTEILDPARITVRNGHAFVYRFSQPQPPPGLQILSDSNSRPTASAATITENGLELGPTHSRHIEIETIGSGRVSHWGAEELIFSTSDNSDPRTNGRVYALRLPFAYPFDLQPTVWGALILFASTVTALMARLRPTCNPRASISLREVKAADGACALLFLIIAFTSQKLLLGTGTPLVLHATDAGNVAGFVAGWLYPERFTSDLVLDDRQNYAFYVTALIPVVMVFNIFTEDVGTAYALLYFPLIFFQLLGFYLLGKYLFRSWVWALLLALITFPPIMMFGSSEFWGIYSEPITRMGFGSIFPFLLLSFLCYANRPRWLAWLFVLCGVTVYFHPVSAPTVALAFWFGALVFIPPGTSPLRHLRRLILAGLAFLAAAVPFALIFFGGFPSLQPSSPSAIDHVEPSTIFSSLAGPEYYDAVHAVISVLENAGLDYAYVLVPGAFAFFLIPWIRPEHGRVCLFFLLFMFGLVLGSFGIAFLDQQISASLGRSPAQLDLIRNVRFAMPVLMLGCVWLAREVYGRLLDIPTGSARMASVLMLATMVAATLMLWRASPTRVSETLNISDAETKILTQDAETSDMLRFIRSLPPHSRVLPLDAEIIGLAVRYGGLQPVVYLQKDISFLLYSGSPKRFEWARYYAATNRVLAAPNSAEAQRDLNYLLELTEAQYLLFDLGWLRPPVVAAALQTGHTVSQSGRWALVRVTGLD